MTPRRVGFLFCSAAPPLAEPAGPSVWCTMMFLQGWALATSPQGASQTIFSPGMSGVPEARASVARSGVWAAAENEKTMASSAIAGRRNFMQSKSGGAPALACFCGSGAPADGLRDRIGPGIRDKGWRRIVAGKAVAAVALGLVEGVVGGRDQPV